MKVLSIFTGAGGMDIGFHGDFAFLGKKYEKTKFHTSTTLELNKFACDTLKNNQKYFGKSNIINANILEFDKTKISGKFDVLIGGFPCVTFSMVGKRKGIVDNINGKLYKSFAEYVEYFKPKVFVAENVKGILSSNKGEAIKIIKKRFEKTGYKLKIYLVNFGYFGVPQLRERVLFIGVRNDIQREFIPPEKNNKLVTTKEAFKNVEGLPNHIYTKQKATVTERLLNIPEGGNFKDLPPELAIKGLMSNIYRRLDRNKPAYTVLASGGGGTWTYHYEEPRAITNRERARLQGFPDDFIFYGTNAEIRKQIGNAVPPVGIYPFVKRIEALLLNKKIETKGKDLLEEILIK